MLTAIENFVRLRSLDDRKSGHKYTQGLSTRGRRGEACLGQARKGHKFRRWGIAGSDRTAAGRSEPPSRARRQLGALSSSAARDWLYRSSTLSTLSPWVSCPPGFLTLAAALARPWPQPRPPRSCKKLWKIYGATGPHPRRRVIPQQRYDRQGGLQDCSRFRRLSGLRVSVEVL